MDRKRDRSILELETYAGRANPMMHRPIVKEEVLDFMRTRQDQLTGFLAEIQQFAANNNIPVIPQETVVYFQFMLSSLLPEKILEIGTAIGFSTLLFAETCPKARITTVERYEEMLSIARTNFAEYDQRDQIQLIEGDAAEILPKLTEQRYDFIFMDSAKTQYVKFLPYLLNNLSENGILVIDDVFQAGDITKSLKELPRRQRNITKGLNSLFDAVYADEKLQTMLLPLGDGLLLIKCKKIGAVI
ncbi:MAG: O-methyltransferase [Streptococcaceae bacterium]|nr:O-methyltransferase [Streptococcaceae bacterium]